jgi:hypothetical protein
MEQKKYILKRPWTLKNGTKKMLYFGYNEEGILDCIENKDMAKVMTKEDAECWRLVLTHGYIWSIEEIEMQIDIAKHETKSSPLACLRSFLINSKSLFGCHNIGQTCVVSFK